METYKKDLIDFLLHVGALKLGEFQLKSKRISPYFINVGDLNTGSCIKKLGEAFTSVILSLKEKPNVLFGPSYKGIPLAVSTSVSLNSKGEDIGFAFDRKEVKEYGEATGADLQRQVIVGKEIKDGNKIVIVEDVFTTGQTKYDTLTLLNKIAKDLKYLALVIAVDRQEVGIDGKNAIKEFEQMTGIPVISILNAFEIYEHLKTKPEFKEDTKKIACYLRCYGTEEVRSLLGGLEQKIIAKDRSVVIACDVPDIEKFEEIVRETSDIEAVGAYKIGSGLALNYGLAKIVDTTKKYTDKPIIYDHQKAGTDIPDTGKNFARACKKAGVDAVILFPQAGPETERAWIYHALTNELKVIVGGRMTHPAYSVSEGGWILDDGTFDMYRIAAQIGINNFVVPGNKPEVIEKVKEIVEAEGVSPVFFAPGFIAQGGKIEEVAKKLERWHAIIGRGIYEARDTKQAALDYTSQL